MNFGLDPNSIGTYGSGMSGAGGGMGAGATQTLESLVASIMGKQGAGANGLQAANPNATGLGMNIGTAQLGLGGLQALAGIWGSHQANKLAKDQFKFTKDITNTNLANQIQSYNTALSDRSNTRAVMEGRDQASAQAYVDQNKLRR